MVQLKSKTSNGFTFGLSQESRYSTILISMNRGQIQAANCLLLKKNVIRKSLLKKLQKKSPFQ